MKNEDSAAFIAWSENPEYLVAEASYNEENMIISRLEAGTTVWEFKDMITTSSNIIVRDSGGNEVDDYDILEDIKCK